MMTATQPSDHPPHTHAVALAGLGFRVLPIRPGQKHPPMAAWQEAATDRRAAIDAWWNGLYRDYGVGIATGHLADGTAFFVLDIDDREHHSGSDTLAELEHEHGDLPDTITSITGSGGEHRFFTVPDGMPTPRNDQSGKLGPGLDIRGEGGQVVVAPTIHPNGNTYQWDTERSPSRMKMAEAPAWLMSMLTPAPEVAPKVTPVKRDDTYQVASTPADRYNDRTTWTELLEADGWTLSHTRDGEDYWTRPGKDTREGTSATVGWRGNDALKVFTSGVDWLQAEATYSRFQYFAARHHNNDYRQAAKAVIESETPQVTTLDVIPVGEQAPDNQGDEVASKYDADLNSMLLNWEDFWAKDFSDIQWLADPVIALGRAHAIFAPGGTGKSLFSLWLAAALACGKQGLDGEPLTPRRVLYLDYEMTPDDLKERLSAMGYDQTDNLTRLHYALLPSLPPADAPEGGKAIARMAQLVDAELVIIDTFSRAVSGDENDADTVRAFYRWTGLHLKAEGRAFLRIDHAGKDVEKGQRGTSAKNDDVDIVWQMIKADGGFKLTNKKGRMGWIPDSVALLQYDTPHLHYKIADEVAPAGTDLVVADLDALQVPPSVSARKAAQMLRESGNGTRDILVRAAQKRRMRRIVSVDRGVSDAGRTPGRASAPDAGRTPGRATPEMAPDQVRTHPGTRWDAPPAVYGPQSVPLGTDAAHPAPPGDHFGEPPDLIQQAIDAAGF
jgi:hypothetical protein